MRIMMRYVNDTNYDENYDEYYDYNYDKNYDDNYVDEPQGRVPKKTGNLSTFCG